uniref:NADH dehydrogenase subunit 6 n=1 Tax=Dactylogyrus simplex TaxID=2736736 RepID=UPI002E7AAA5E|nr:NADH dehydrogenase subunit 6 [Dactylogyrus simplex]WPS93111.1 NADH dehydrogenase subunit 6 [Dactylogyrus simplex]
MTTLLSVYYTSIVLFGFVGSVVSFCLLLLVNALCCFTLILLVGGFSWYALLLYIVYIGGVYVLFIFVSVFLPNNLNAFSAGAPAGVSLLFLTWEVSNGFNSVGSWQSEHSFNFCSGLEGPLYLFLCLFLMLGFFIVSLVSSSKESFIR